MLDLDPAIATQNTTAEELTAFVRASLSTDVRVRVEHRSVLTVPGLAVSPEEARRTLQALLCDEDDCSVTSLAAPARRLQSLARFLWTSVLSEGTLDTPAIDRTAVSDALGANVTATLQAIRVTVDAPSVDALERLPSSLATQLAVDVAVVTPPTEPPTAAPSPVHDPTLLAISVAIAAANACVACLAVVPVRAQRKRT